jgi:hypothetical protein
VRERPFFVPAEHPSAGPDLNPTKKLGIIPIQKLDIFGRQGYKDFQIYNYTPRQDMASLSGIFSERMCRYGRNSAPVFPHI